MSSATTPDDGYKGQSRQTREQGRGQGDDRDGTAEEFDANHLAAHHVETFPRIVEGIAAQQICGTELQGRERQGGEDDTVAVGRVGNGNQADQAIGVADRLLQLAVGYASERKQFGQPIGSFQAVKHMLASAKVRLEYARPLVHRAAASVATSTR